MHIEEILCPPSVPSCLQMQVGFLPICEVKSIQILNLLIPQVFSVFKPLRAA